MKKELTLDFTQRMPARAGTPLAWAHHYLYVTRVTVEDNMNKGQYDRCFYQFEFVLATLCDMQIDFYRRERELHV